MAAGAARSLGMIALTVTALLGSAYALGRTLVPDAPPQVVVTTATSAEDPHHADQPPATSREPAEPTPDQRPGEPDGTAQQDGPSTPDNADGPVPGTRTTTGTGQVALTFDDGPHPQYTPQVLAALREHQVTATFCVVGQNAEAYPWLIQQIVADGHTLCNHSWDHDVALGARAPEHIRTDLLRTSAAIRAAVPDAPISWYRQPGGAWTWPVVSVARDLGMTPLHWSVDTSDWRAPGASRITAAVVDWVQRGSVVLLHDAGGDRQGTVDALYRILPDLTSRFDVAALPTGTT
ncbi:Peptidoglycan/xylan/chitin deacetylase, PgdA/CDA1 family [Micromonospora nigra]|uniref:Peptidoglycan/xylan/chitin deacetylase, PgdA/CDA1 family n=1 Tax=Micromonospora nigra TaxID=145857 RepID=A0A1C6RUE9_9ACTN|nr:polysaccharide deacetylase family protein [Micromonospora nigra]SCL20639.1 Peptidoglycan/xylan/chitin deacetylase, PgdA/CDA1 family [Micromonospora nigra]